MSAMEEGGAGDAPYLGEIPGGKDKVDTSMEEETETSLLSKVVGNGVIGEKIAGYLTLSDLKAASEVSRDWCRMVRSSKAFGEVAMLLVCKETVSLDKFLVDSEFPWKALEVDVTLPPTVVEIITDILATVNTLHLRLKRTDRVEEEVLTGFLTALLTSAPELKSLRLESVFLDQILHDVLSNVNVQEAFKKLTTLEVCTGNKMNDGTHYLDCDDEGDGPFPRNFYQLSCIPMKLEKLVLGKVCTLNGTETDHVKFIPNIISSNSETLVELSVHMSEVWKLEIMKTVHCPNLKRLAITSYGAQAECVALFLTNQPHLEHLCLSTKDKFCTSLLTVLRGKCAKLKSLSLKGNMFIEPGHTVPEFPAHPAPVRINWDFLSGLNSLKQFDICRPASAAECDEFGLSRHRFEGTGVSFLKTLPSTISHIGLRGVKDFWFDIEQDQIVMEQAERVALLMKFQNLSSLTLIRCDENFLDDELVQVILRNFTQLQKLEITHGSSLTNNAITGINAVGELTGVSLSNLKSLTHLKLKGCNRITIDALVRVLVFPHLQSLEYLGCYSLSTSEMTSIVSQNPSLETLAIDVPDFEDVHASAHELRDELKKVNKRFCKVVKLPESDEWFDQDSDSDADEIPTGWGGSDISGGPMDPDYYQDFVDLEDEFDEDDDDDYDEDEFDVC